MIPKPVLLDITLGRMTKQIKMLATRVTLKDPVLVY